MAIAIGLLKTLLELSRSKKSGALDVTGGGTRVRLYVEDGAIVFADEGTVGETLGRILVREKVLRDEQYNAAIEKMAELRAKGATTKLGEILLSMKFLTPAQLDAALSAQVRQKVVRAIGFGSASYKFIECHGGPLEVAGRYATTLEPLVLAALRLAPEDHIDELLDLALTRYPELRGDGTADGGKTRDEIIRQMDAFEFQPQERAFAFALDGTRTSADILGAAANVDPAVILAALLLTDCLDLHGAARTPTVRTVAAPEARLPAKRPTPGGGTKAPSIRKIQTPATGQHAVKPVAKRAPASVRPPAADAKEHALEIAARLKQATEAKKSLPPPASSAAGELALWKGDDAPSTVNRLLAEKAFQAGKAHVRANDMKAAAVELKKAAELFPQIEYELWAAWTAMRADKAGEANHVPHVRALAEKAIEQDPSLGFAYFALGHLALRAFDANKARELFAKARALDPAATSEAKDVRLKAKEREETKAEDAAPPTPPPPEPPPPQKEEEAEAPVAAPAVPHPAPAPPARKIGPKQIATVAVATVVGIVVALLAGRSSDPPKTTTSSSTTRAVDAAPSPTEQKSVAVEEDDAGTLNAATIDATKPLAPLVPDQAHGALVFPTAANGHRLFVDDKMLGELPPPSPVVLPCGKHVVKIGGEGREQDVDVPCAGRVTIAYP